MKKILVALGIILSVLFILRHSNALCVSAQKANIRSGPGTNYEIVWEVYKYMPFSKVGVSLSGDWYAVRDVDRDVNWIHKSLLTGKYKCAVVKTEEVNVRTGPGTKYSKGGVANKYFSFKVIGTNGVWVRLRDEWNNTVWIHRDYLWIK
jgi:SH3-like domain-containing protein